MGVIQEKDLEIWHLDKHMHIHSQIYRHMFYQEVRGTTSYLFPIFLFFCLSIWLIIACLSPCCLHSCFQTTFSISIVQFAFWHVCSLSLYCSERQAVSVSHMCLLTHVPWCWQSPLSPPSVISYHTKWRHTHYWKYTHAQWQCPHMKNVETHTECICMVVYDCVFRRIFLKPEGHLE